jgi:hypothetical protein
MGRAMRTVLAAAAFVFGLGVSGFVADDARADGSSVVTLGVGGGVGIHKAAGFDLPAETAFVNQASVRAKLLWIFGLDYSYDLTRDMALVNPVAGELNYKAKMRATALLYPYSGEYVAFYLGAGIGGAKLADLTRIDAPTNSYHAGLGFEFHVASHFSIDTSFMILAPGARSIAETAVARVDAALANGGVDAVTQLEVPGFDDFVSLKNHEFMVRLFLFL